MLGGNPYHWLLKKYETLKHIIKNSNEEKGKLAHSHRSTSSWYELTFTKVLVASQYFNQC